MQTSDYMQASGQSVLMRSSLVINNLETQRKRIACTSFCDRKRNRKRKLTEELKETSASVLFLRPALQLQQCISHPLATEAIIFKQTSLGKEKKIIIFCN